MKKWNRKTGIYTIVNLNSRWRTFWNYVIWGKPINVEISFWTSNPMIEPDLRSAIDDPAVKIVRGDDQL